MSYKHKLLTQAVLEILGPNPINVKPDYKDIDWLSYDPIPLDDIKDKIAELESKENTKKIKSDKKDIYDKDGLTFDYWNEINIEHQQAIIDNDQGEITSCQDKINDFLSRRKTIKDGF